MANEFSSEELVRLHEAVTMSMTEGFPPKMIADMTLRILQSGGVTPDGNGDVVFGPEAFAILPTLPPRTKTNQVELARLRREYDAIKGDSHEARAARARVREKIIRSNTAPTTNSDVAALRNELDSVKGDSDQARAHRARLKEQILNANSPPNEATSWAVRPDLGNDLEHLSFSNTRGKFQITRERNK